MSNSTVNPPSLWSIFDVTKTATHDVISSIVPITSTLKRTAEHLDWVNEQWVEDAQERYLAERKLRTTEVSAITTSDEVLTPDPKPQKQTTAPKPPKQGKAPA